MSSNSNNSWAVWLVIILMLVVVIGIIIWFAIDNNIPGKIGSDQGNKTQSMVTKKETIVTK